MVRRTTFASSLISTLLSVSLLLLVLPVSTPAQNTVTGAFEGFVRNARTNEAIPGAIVRFTNQVTGIPTARRSDQQGRFYQGLLAPGTYVVEVTVAGYKPFRNVQRVYATRTDNVQPLPVLLEPETTAEVTPTPTPQQQVAEAKGSSDTPKPPDTTTTTTTTAPTPPPDGEGQESIDINRTDGRRGGAFTDYEVSTLPLGSVTRVRSFDELALLLPGVTLPPQTQGSVAGPGVGAGVGSAGQFSVNGLRSRANNFTMDGSDNNDEDIGVRRQGFLTLVPQPIESIQEYQVITLLAPAQFGRNIGAQVNAVSKSGGSAHHGTVYGFLNSSRLNSPNFFDDTSGNTSGQLRAGSNQLVTLDGTPIPIVNDSGEEDSFTLGQFGLVIGGPIVRDKTFYFFAAEGQVLNATQETNFAVPTVEQRGFLGTGATGLPINPITGENIRAFPTSLNGDMIFSLFPFPNNPRGVYGPNTFTRTLPASGEGKIFSGKVDHNFRLFGREQSLTARYNFTDDERDIPVTGGALFSSLRPRVRTQNFSAFHNMQLNAADSSRPIFNQFRASYGRTRLNFEELRDRELTLPSSALPGTPFLLNRPAIGNFTIPQVAGVPNTGDIEYLSFGFNTEDEIGPVGQVILPGFSPIGVDVFNFPQRRINNTYQVADTLTLKTGPHNFAFGTDIRRAELSSDLSPNSRSLATFGTGFLLFPDGLAFLSPTDLAATGAASGFTQSYATGPTDISLRYYQLNFFAQDEWRVRPNLTVSYGLRYEYNTTPRERQNRIESAFSSPLIQSLLPALGQFIEGRREIYDPDRNNFGPRVGFAYAPNWFGADRATVLRAGYGLYYDQIIGSVVSQSRNVFPNFVSVNFGGGLPAADELDLFNPASTTLGGIPLVTSGTVNRFNPDIDLGEFLAAADAANFPIAIGATLPTRRLEVPMAHHYSFTFEQQVSRGLVLSAAYVGTTGRKLLRFTTPNGGPNNVLVAILDVTTTEPSFSGFVLPAFSRSVPGLGAINRFETTGRSRYDAFQLQARGRLWQRMQFQAGYTYSHAKDDASDVFDLAGSSALPQNSNNLAAEYGPSNFDVRHRFSYNVTYALPSFRERGRAFSAIFGGLELASTGQFHTGQPFTVNSLIDVNLDGNLTDRLDSTQGLFETGNRINPLNFFGNSFDLLAPLGEDGSVGRNSFRTGNLLLINLAVNKNIPITETQRLLLRAEFFNLPNRDNFGVPVRFLEAPGFGRATDTVTPGRRIQFALKYLF